MIEPVKILFRVIVKPFYKENFNTFLFVFIMMFFIVGNVDGAGIYQYHYSLVKGMLSSTPFLLLVFSVWFLYARKCAAFVSAIILHPQYIFLQELNRFSKGQQFFLLMTVAASLFLPILLYSIFIVYVGLDLQAYQPLFITLLFLFCLIMVTVMRHLHLLNNFHGKSTVLPALQVKTAALLSSSQYPFIILRFTVESEKMIWLMIKLFTCGVLYLLALNNTASHYDSKLVFLFFNFGILANGALVFRIRQFEEDRLSYYRSLPVTRLHRYAQYIFIYFILLIPEFITAFALTPVHLTYSDALGFSLCAFSLVLVLNSITFLCNLQIREYISLCVPVFCLQYAALVTGGFPLMYLLFFIAAPGIFFITYNSFEKIASQ